MSWSSQFDRLAARVAHTRAREESARRELARSRREAIISRQPLKFEIQASPYIAANVHPWYADRAAQEVSTFEPILEEAAAHYGVDADFVKAVVWMETTHGHWDRVTSWVMEPKSLRPMNIYVRAWQRFVTREQMEDDGQNICFGVWLLRELTDRTRPTSYEAIATVYNVLGSTHVSRYGKGVDRYRQMRPWMVDDPGPSPVPHPTPTSTPTPASEEPRCPGSWIPE